MSACHLLTVREFGDHYKVRKFQYKPVIIRLKGQWLAQAGFKDGDRVEIHIVEKGRLEIRLASAV